MNCENCSTELSGAFCHKCGQRVESLPGGVLGYLAHLVSGVAGYDSKLLRSLVALVFRPGRLTDQYLRGKRIRYVEPLQLYLLSAAVFFLINAYKPFVHFDVATGSVASSLGPASATGSMPASQVERLTAQGVTIEVFAERFDAWVSAYLPVLLVAMLVLLAVVFWSLNWRSEKPFAVHAVFTLHWSAFFLLIEGVRRVIPLPATWSASNGILGVVISFIYLAVAMRVLYRRGWPLSIARTLVSLLLFYVLISVWMGSTLFLALRFA
ncbi:MAG: DUF3667 domain-containing protein [Gemmatimonadota bacterium]